MELEFTPMEDLMREHGVLNRILLIYDDISDKLKNNIDVNYKLIYQSAYIIRVFIEDYHEKTEEKYVFPLLLKNNDDVKLVNDLLSQHKYGRKITKKILDISSKEKCEKNDQILIKYLDEFIRMYRFHESREDTVIFEKIKIYTSKEKYEKMGEIFEKEENDKLGKNGFKRILASVEKIEKNLNINVFNKTL